ncbi:MAG TPA: ABC transporter permease [Candidatus Paceibacterota bacterium]
MTSPTRERLRRISSLSFSLAKVHFKLRNEGTYLGMFWYLLNPVVLFAVLLFVKHAAFSHISIPNYPLYLLVGLVMQNYLSRSVLGAVDVIRKNGGFIRSVKIPLESLVVASSLNLLYAHAFEAILVAGTILFLGVPATTIVFYALSLLLFALFALGVSFAASTLGVFANDIGNIWPIFSQILFFITPIFYEVEPGTLLYAANQFNPLYYFISLARWPAYQQPGASLPVLLAIAASLAAIGLAVGATVFRMHKRKFAELV